MFKAEDRFKTLRMQKRFGAERHIKDTKGGEARIAEPPASGRNTALCIETAKAGWSGATKKEDDGLSTY
jgi:hypothetical protein